MTSRRRAATSTRHDPAVVAFLRELDHPRKPEIEALRDLILAASPAILEGIKWNAPSFRTATIAHFATFNLRAADRVRLILHAGAKKRARAASLDSGDFDDPAGLLEQLGPDRCLVTITDAGDLRAKRAALTSILRQWLARLEA